VQETCKKLTAWGSGRLTTNHKPTVKSEMLAYENAPLAPLIECPENYWDDDEMIALLYLQIKRACHSCCHAREVTEVYCLNQFGKDFFAEYADQYGNVELCRLQDSLDISSGADHGSYGDYDSYDDYDSYGGYDSYDDHDSYEDVDHEGGSDVITSGRIISPEYAVNLGNHSNLQTTAYYIAEKDSFSQSPDIYWKMACNHVQEQVLLSIKMTRAIEKSQKQRQKMSLLRDALVAEGMDYREDSKLCQAWISGNSDKTLEEVVRVMAECKWCIEHHNMFQRMKDYTATTTTTTIADDSTDNTNTARGELFSLIKAEILLKNPLPVPYPWCAKNASNEEEMSKPTTPHSSLKNILED